jgi:DNA polymerase III sliding clamp (beta) subunit (PCNA family)
MPITGDISVRPQAFAAAVAWAVKWIAGRPAAPIAAGVALDVADGTLSLTTYNETVTARATVAIEGLATGTGAGHRVRAVPGRPGRDVQGR